MKLKNIIFSESIDQEQEKTIQVKNRSEVPKNFTGIAIFPGGPKFWFSNGKLHRENDLPAIEWSNGTKWWYFNGKLHRENDLPAIEYPNEYKEWYFNGIKRKEEEWKKLVKNRHQNPNDIFFESIKISI